MKCPICEKESLEQINMDAIICPEHGTISGLMIMQMKGSDNKLEKLIELRQYESKSWAGYEGRLDV